MRCLERNKQYVVFALYQGKTDKTDSAGHKTGEKMITYTCPVCRKMNVSAARGTADVEQFGTNNPYSRSIVTDDMVTAFDTTTVFWLGLGAVYPHNEIHAYATGECAIYNNKVYKAKEATSGAWDATKWVEVKYNHSVVTVAKSVNSVMIALKEVSVS